MSASTPPPPDEGGDLFTHSAAQIINTLVAVPGLDATPHRRFHADVDHVEVLEPYSGEVSDMTTTTDAIGAILSGAATTTAPSAHQPEQAGDSEMNATGMGSESVDAEIESADDLTAREGESGQGSAEAATSVESEAVGVGGSEDDMLADSFSLHDGEEAHPEVASRAAASVELGNIPVNDPDALGEDPDLDDVGAAPGGGGTEPEYDLIPVGALPAVTENNDHVAYDPGANSFSVGLDSVDDDDPAGEESARFDIEQSEPGTVDKIADFYAEHRKPVWLGAGAAVLVVLLAVALLGGAGGDDSDTPVANIATSAPRVTDDTTPGPGSEPDTTQDSQVPITSATSRCPSGSSDPLSAFDNQMNTAWICVRSSGIDGQVLNVRLNGPYVISSIAIVPGFNSATASGEDQWVKHRTVTRVKYSFNDADRTIVEQATQNNRNEVPTQLNPPVLASSIKITILQTTAAAGGQDQSESDDVSGGPSSRRKRDSFAVSSITILGHKPS